MDGDSTPRWDGMRIEDVPPPAGFPGDDDAREEQWPGEANEGEVWWFRLNADWPGDADCLLAIGQQDGEERCTYSAVEWADELSGRSPVQHLRMVMDLVAEAMDPGNPGTCN